MELKFDDLFSWGLSTSYDPIRWEQDGDVFTGKFIIPGATKQDTSVQVKDDTLIVSFEGNDFQSKFRKEYIISKKAEVKGKLESGVLTIIVTKQKAKIKEIDLG